MNPRTRIHLLAAFTVLWIAPLSVHGTTIDPKIWRQLVLDSDFIGEIECVTGGESVAQYKAVDTWKGGLKAGDTFTLAIPIDMWGPTRIAIPGDRFLVFARGRGQFSLPAYPSSAKDIWLAEAQRGADFDLPPFQGLFKLPVSGNRPPFPYSEALTIDDFRSEVQDFLALGKSDQERELLVALTRKYVGPRGAKNKLASHNALIEEVAAQPDVAAVLRKLLESTEHFHDLHDLREILRRGRHETLEFLRGDPLYGVPFSADPKNENVLKSLARTTNPEAFPQYDPGTPMSILSQLLPDAREVFDVGPSHNRFRLAMQIMCHREPEAVVQWLLNWRYDDSIRFAPSPYDVALLMGQGLTGDRVAHFTTLLNAQEPYIQAAAAVFLTFDNPEIGRQCLVDKSALDGDPGAWCAVTRVMFNDATAVPRALEVFAGPIDNVSIKGAHHVDLQRRLRVLLANAAHTSGVPFTPPPLPAFGATNTLDTLNYMNRWWKSEQDHITLNNPWLLPDVLINPARNGMSLIPLLAMAILTGLALLALAYRRSRRPAI